MSTQKTPCQRLVVKFGTNLLTGGTDRLDLETLASLVGQVASLHREGKEVIVVTSGAIAAGRHHLGLAREHRDIASRQVMAAVGQSHLMHVYEEFFGWHGITVAQALLTRGDLLDRHGYLNTRNTLLALLELKVVPIVNENDVVAVEEIREASFGDNDNLSALVANLVDADLLVLLTDTGGLYTADPKRHPEARLIPRVERIDEAIERLAGGADERGTGGMATKVQAAKLATASGVAVAICHGREPQALLRLAQGEALGTFFSPAATRLESRQRWLLSGLGTRGALVIDPGAATALLHHNRSLLPAGVREVEGDFDRGDAVDIRDAQGHRVACGIVNYSARDIAIIKGSHSDGISSVLGYEYGAEIIHRNNMVVLPSPRPEKRDTNPLERSST